MLIKVTQIDHWRPNSEEVHPAVLNLTKLV